MEPGIYRGMPFEEYLEIDALSSSAIKDFLVGPDYYYYKHLDPMRPEKKDSKSMADGRLGHTFMLELESFGERYAIGPEVSSKNTKKWKDFVAHAEAMGRVPIDEKDAEWLCLLKARVAQHPVCNALLSNATETELTVIWEEQGQLAKARFDALHARAIGDLKKTAKFDRFDNQIWELRYDVQAAWYKRAARALDIGVERFIFIPFEREWPVRIMAREIHDEELVLANEDIDMVLREFSNCKANNEWLKPQGLETVKLPPWARRRDE
jgi:hypothetical protein